MQGSKDNAIMVWEAPSGRLIATGKEHSAAVSSVAISHKYDSIDLLTNMLVNQLQISPALVASG